MAQNITLMGASYSAVPAVTLPKTGGGTATFTDVTPTTAAASDVASGKIFFNSSGVQTTGTASGGGGGGIEIYHQSADDVYSDHLVFNNMVGSPTSFVITVGNMSLNSARKAVSIVYDGTYLIGQSANSSDGISFINASGDLGQLYQNDTLMVGFTSSVYSFDDENGYTIAYTVGGSSSDIHTSEVQVGSGATSITFTGLTEEPSYWSLIFKDAFGTSSGYQRVACVANNGTNTYGLSLDSSVHDSSSYWSASYNNGSFTITSQGTNQGGYFHQPGYYQLTYANGTVPTPSIEVEPLSVTQNGTYTAPDGKAYSPVTVNVSSSGMGTLLTTVSLGTLSTSSTSAADTGKTVTLASSTNWDDYDLLLVDISVDSVVNGRHTSSVSFVILTGTSNVTTKNTYTVGSNVWNSKASSNGTKSTRQSTSKYGVYVNSASVSSGTLTLPIYDRYNSNNTGTLNGTYTARVYGIKLIDLIGG